MAAESHVDRSIDGPGVHRDQRRWARSRCSTPPGPTGSNFRPGAGPVPLPPRLDRRGLRLARRDGQFTETTPYDPQFALLGRARPSSDHFVRAWHHTYGLPTLVTNCSNNYGPYQFPEKLIPLMILNAEGKPLPIYGNGRNVRDWLFVDDHCQALRLRPRGAAPGETYNIGGHNERTNIEVVGTLCQLLDEMRPGLAARRLLVADHVSSPTGRATTAATPSTPARSSASWAGGRSETSRPA